MSEYVGLDVSQRETSICVVDGAGRKVWQGRCPSTPEAIAVALRERAQAAVRVGMETGPLAVWHWHGLRAIGMLVTTPSVGGYRAFPASACLRRSRS
jgi:transposase